VVSFVLIGVAGGEFCDRSVEGVASTQVRGDRDG
jgi:hypothetical protein